MLADTFVLEDGDTSILIVDCHQFRRATDFASFNSDGSFDLPIHDRDAVSDRQLNTFVDGRMDADVCALVCL